MYRWDFDDPARQHFASLSSSGQEELAAFMNAAVLVDPIEYQPHPGEPTDATKLLRTLHFGRRHEGLVTFLVSHRMTSCSSSGSSGSATERTDEAVRLYGWDYDPAV